MPSNQPKIIGGEFLLFDGAYFFDNKKKLMVGKGAKKTDRNIPVKILLLPPGTNRQEAQRLWGLLKQEKLDVLRTGTQQSSSGLVYYAVLKVVEDARIKPAYNQWLIPVAISPNIPKTTVQKPPPEPVRSIPIRSHKRKRRSLNPVAIILSIVFLLGLLGTVVGFLIIKPKELVVSEVYFDNTQDVTVKSSWFLEDNGGVKLWASVSIGKENEYQLINSQGEKLEGMKQDKGIIVFENPDNSLNPKDKYYIVYEPSIFNRAQWMIPSQYSVKETFEKDGKSISIKNWTSSTRQDKVEILVDIEFNGDAVEIDESQSKLFLADEFGNIYDLQITKVSSGSASFSVVIPQNNMGNLFFVVTSINGDSDFIAQWILTK